MDSFFSAIEKKITETVAPVKKSVENAFDAISQKVSDTLATVLSTVTDKSDAVKKATTDCYDAMKTAADTPLSTLASTVESKMQAMVSLCDQQSHLGTHLRQCIRCRGPGCKAPRRGRGHPEPAAFS